MALGGSIPATTVGSCWGRRPRPAQKTERALAASTLFQQPGPDGSVQGRGSNEIVRVIQQRGLAMGPTIAIAGALCVALGCGGDMDGAKSAQDARVRRPTEIVLERCAVDGEGVEKFDADGDGRAEVTRHVEGGREVCRVADLNFDGKPDRTSYFDASGKLRKVEADLDRDGRVDEIASYVGGLVSERDRATTLSGKLDTWEFYEQGKLVRTERDENGDGVVDQWWEYPTAQCPLIHSDSDGDGRPDPAATIDYCKATGYVPPPVKEETPGANSPDFSPPDRVSETSNVPADGAAAGTGGAANGSSGSGGTSSGGKTSSGGTSATGSNGSGANANKPAGTGGASGSTKPPGTGGSSGTQKSPGTGGSAGTTQPTGTGGAASPGPSGSGGSR